jgi:hypothetical protein
MSHLWLAVYQLFCLLTMQMTAVIVFPLGLLKFTHWTSCWYLIARMLTEVTDHALFKPSHLSFELLVFRICSAGVLRLIVPTLLPLHSIVKFLESPLDEIQPIWWHPHLGRLRYLNRMKCVHSHGSIWTQFSLYAPIWGSSHRGFWWATRFDLYIQYL